MGEIAHVRASQVEKSTDDAQLLLKHHRNEFIQVESRLSLTLGLMPKIELFWAVTNRYQGSPLLVFHNQKGFADDRSDNLSAHGNLIVDTTQNGGHSVHLQEGMHYFTFLLRKRGLLYMLFEMRSPPLRFSIEVPNVENALRAMQNKRMLAEEAQKLHLLPKEHEIVANDTELRLLRSRRTLEEFAANPTAKSMSGDKPRSYLHKELDDVDVFVEAFFARRHKIAELKTDPKFRKLKKAEREEILRRIEQRLDPGELSARREMRES